MKSDISGNRSNKSSFVQRLPDGTEIGAQAAGCFTKSLLDWHRTRNDRSLPWKNEKDPYRIWLSEIILQQTRAEQGIPYYLRFIEKYPDVASLAEAADEDVFRLWQGLGYYNRCRNLLVTARYVHNELEGQFPESYEGLLRLKGVGAYTAAAVASFAFGLPQAVLDGNVYRVLSRYFAVDAIPGTTIGRKRFQNLADLCLEPEASGAYNQAIMDLGATICTPLSPGCEQCPLAKRCQARTRGLTELLPVKTKNLSLDYKAL